MLFWLEQFMEWGIYLKKNKINNREKIDRLKYDTWLKFSILIVILIIVLSIFYVVLSLTVEPVIDTKSTEQYSKTITVYADNEYAPYSYIDDDNNPQGYDVELIYKLANKMKVNIDLKMIPWTMDLSNLDISDVDIILGLDYNEDNSNLFHLSHPVQINEYVAFGIDSLKNTSQLYTKNIGLLNGSIASELFIKPNNLHDNVTYFSSYEKAFESVLNGKIDYLIGRYSVGKMVLQQEGISNIRSQGDILSSNAFCFGVSKEQNELFEQLNLAIDDMNRSGELAKLSDKWLGHHIHTMSFINFVYNYPKQAIITIGIFAVFIIYLFIKRQEELLIIKYEKEAQIAEFDMKILQNNLSKQDELNKKQRNFLNNISHELKTPLTIIQGLTYGVEDGVYKVDDDYVKNTFHNQLAIMQNLVSEILTIARINWKDEITREPFLFSDLVLKVGNNLQYLIKQKNIQLNIDLDDSVVIGARDKIERVINNLYSNAIYYSPEGANIYITIKDGCFTIKNTGVSIKDEDLLNLWEPFYKIETVISNTNNKTGLGLYIVKQILERHKSSYFITSDYDSVTASFTLEQAYYNTEI